MKDSKANRTIVRGWILGDTIGAGAYSKVKSCVRADSGKEAAAKILDLSRLVQQCRREYELIKNRAFKECRIIQVLKHKHIIDLYDVFEENSKVYIIMEKAKEDLYEHLKNSMQKPLTEERIRDIFRQILSAVEYCHANLVIHRDIKLENLLVTEDTNTIKLADFGWSSHITPGQLFSTSCGSLQYTAPEVIKSVGYVGPASDIWSLGVVLYILLHRCFPFDSHNPLEMYHLAKSRSLSLSPQLSPVCQHIITRMLDPDPNSRATMQELRNHPWTNIGYDLPPKSRLESFPPVAGLPDPDAIVQLCYLGFEPQEIISAVTQPHSEPSQVVTMYHNLVRLKQNRRIQPGRQFPPSRTERISKTNSFRRAQSMSSPEREPPKYYSKRSLTRDYTHDVSPVALSSRLQASLCAKQNSSVQSVPNSPSTSPKQRSSKRRTNSSPVTLKCVKDALKSTKRGHSSAPTSPPRSTANSKGMKAKMNRARNSNRRSKTPRSKKKGGRTGSSSFRHIARKRKGRSNPCSMEVAGHHTHTQHPPRLSPSSSNSDGFQKVRSRSEDNLSTSSADAERTNRNKADPDHGSSKSGSCSPTHGVSPRVTSLLRSAASLLHLKSRHAARPSAARIENFCSCNERGDLKQGR